MMAGRARRDVSGAYSFACALTALARPAMISFSDAASPNRR
jgi:hypothetical protein